MAVTDSSALSSVRARTLPHRPRGVSRVTVCHPSRRYLARRAIESAAAGPQGSLLYAPEAECIGKRWKPCEFGVKVNLAITLKRC
jgi:hypothetical protein